MDRLREELSCAICLEICFEPSTTPCGHSFCKKCLKCATTRCGRRCPKCRDLLGNGRSCTVNTVLWNTIQLLFPDEIAARRNASPETSATQAPVVCNNPDSGSRGNVRTDGSSARLRSVRSGILRRPLRAGRPAIVELSGEQEPGRAAAASQSEDAALALRLQREEMMGALRETQQRPERNTVYMARANLRAMASRAIQLRSRRRQC
ncbi:unnamed protein product [Spirodela intermedia]|uniref:RING-type E3 ubiquitin transferase n=1 Tax=Spirodela intermedia TaxID=51605 RepID=A0A7I8INZ4_SPIIN|nr:unnamed protein product [Spirodela intermedia]CAA6659667.1 unnamed protein product [Spirodela intermedia]